jgi:hypothetical protein
MAASPSQRASKEATGSKEEEGEGLNEKEIVQHQNLKAKHKIAIEDLQRLIDDLSEQTEKNRQFVERYHKEMQEHQKIINEIEQEEWEFPIYITQYLHSSKEGNLGDFEEMEEDGEVPPGWVEKHRDNLMYMLYEVGIDLEVYEDGTYKILKAYET